MGGNPISRADPRGLDFPGSPGTAGGTAGPPTGFHFYGNWGGPRYTGGYPGLQWNELTPEQKANALPPIDPQDECYRTHDMCYGNCRTDNSDPSQRQVCAVGCDRKASECLANLSCKAPWNDWRAKGASWYFSNSNPNPN